MKPIKIRNILLIPFSLLIITFSALVGFQTLLSSQNYIQNLLKEIMVDTYQLIASEIRHRLTLHEQLNQTNRIYLQQRGDAKNFSEINDLMLNQLNTFKNIDAVYFSSRDNWFSGYARFQDNVVHMYANESTHFNIHYEQIDEITQTRTTLQIAPDYYATQSRWYQDAALEPGYGWGSSFSYYVLPTLALPNSVQITDEKGKTQGVVGNDLFLDNVGNMLDGFFDFHKGNAFIIDESGNLIGSSTHFRPYSEVNGDIIQTNVNDSDDELIKQGMEILRAFQKEGKPLPQLSPITLKGQPYQLGIFQFDHGKDIHWTLFIYLAEQGILEQANESLYQSLSSIVAGMLLTMFLSAFLAHKIATPIHNLNRRVLDWKNNPTEKADDDGTSVPIMEVQQLAESTQKMQNNTAQVMQELRKIISENQHFITEIEKLAMVAENTDDMVLICNDRKEIEWANESFYKNYLRTKDEVHKRDALDLLLPEEAKYSEAQAINLQLKTLGYANIQQIHHDGSGLPHWVKINIRQVNNEHGEVQHYIFIMQDITAQKTYEQELTKWKTVFYAADWGIAISQEDSMTLSLANPTFAKLHGYELSELVNVSLTKFYPDTVLPTIKDYMNIAKDTGSVTFETEHICKNGKRFPVLQNISAFHDQQGELAGYITSIQDISEIQSLQHQLLQSQKMEAMGTLAGGMAHDFNNILASILGNAELCSLYIENINEVFKHNNLGDLSERLDAIVKSCSRASDLTNKILSYSRMDSPEFESLHLNETVKESVSMIHPMLPATIKISLDIAAHIDSVNGNESQLQQVFMNLLTNAVHAIQLADRRIGSIAVSMQNEVDDEGESWLRLVISDNGCGIPQSALAHIFDPFFTTKEKGKGTGLGLSVVSGILRSHGVTIDVETKENEGTDFVLLFPTTDAQVHQPEDSYDANEEEKAQPQAHIVIVDDEKHITDVWGRILLEKGYQVTTFNQPQFALEFITKPNNQVNLVISDYDMAELTGADLCLTLHKTMPDLPLIMLTGYSEKMDDNLAKELGIYRLLLKPISSSALLHSIQQALS